MDEEAPSTEQAQNSESKRHPSSDRQDQQAILEASTEPQISPSNLATDSREHTEPENSLEASTEAQNSLEDKSSSSSFQQEMDEEAPSTEHAQNSASKRHPSPDRQDQQAILEASTEPQISLSNLATDTLEGPLDQESATVASLMWGTEKPSPRHPGQFQAATVDSAALTLADKLVSSLAWQSTQFRNAYSIGMKALDDTKTQLESAQSTSGVFSAQFKIMLLEYAKARPPGFVDEKLAAGFLAHFKSKTKICDITLRRFVYRQINSFVGYRIKAQNLRLQREITAGSADANAEKGDKTSLLLEAAQSIGPISAEVMSPKIFQLGDEDDNVIEPNENKAVAPTPLFSEEAKRELTVVMASATAMAIYPVLIDDKETSDYKELQKFHAETIVWWKTHFETRDSLALSYLSDVPQGRRHGLFLKHGFFLEVNQTLYLPGYLQFESDLDADEHDYAAKLERGWCVVPGDNVLWGFANTFPGKQHLRLVVNGGGHLRATVIRKAEGGDEIFLQYGGKKSARVRLQSFFVFQSCFF